MTIEKQRAWKAAAVAARKALNVLADAVVLDKAFDKTVSSENRKETLPKDMLAALEASTVAAARIADIECAGRGFPEATVMHCNHCGHEFLADRPDKHKGCHNCEHPLVAQERL